MTMGDHMFYGYLLMVPLVIVCALATSFIPSCEHHACMVHVRKRDYRCRHPWHPSLAYDCDEALRKGTQTCEARAEQ